MAEYIEREAAIDAVTEVYYNTPDVNLSVEKFEAAINGILAADVAPVVRCKDCKQGEVDDPDFPDQYYCHAGCGWNNGDFYCAYGEREEGADNG